MKRKKNKRKQSDLYLLTSDIKELNDRYTLLYRDVKNDKNFSEEQIKEACEILLEKYKFEIVELSKQREAEYWENQAKIEAKNNERIPWRRCWLWRLLFRPVTNRAQDIIEAQAALEADEYFTDKENALDNLAKKLYDTPPADVDDVPNSAEQQEPANVLPPSEASTAAHGACDATHQSDEQTEKPAADVAKPPAAAPTSEEPKPKAKPKAKPKKVTKPTDEPPVPTPSTAPAPQLSGQIGIEELAGDK